MEPMRGDAFIHFLWGSRRVNIRLGVLLLIPKSPQVPFVVVMVLHHSQHQLDGRKFEIWVKGCMAGRSQGPYYNCYSGI